MTSTPPHTIRPTPPASPGRPRPRRQGWLVTLGVMAALPALAATALRVLAPSTEQLAKLASFIPYGLAFWLPALILLGAATFRAWRHRASGRAALSALSLACAAGLTAALAWQVPAFIPDGRPAVTEPVTVVSLNVARMADPAATARAASGADVVVFVEARPDWVDSLPTSFRREFPHLVPSASDVADGSAIFSRYPIRSSVALPPSSFSQWAAIIETPQLGALRVVGVHPCNPYCPAGLWVREAEQLRNWLADRDEAIPTVVAGDFNAVDDHRTMRALYDSGFHSAAELAGAGFVPTWPANSRIPPMIGIDHVLVDERLTATAFATFGVPHTDHLGVRAVIAGTDG